MHSTARRRAPSSNPFRYACLLVLCGFSWAIAAPAGRALGDPGRVRSTAEQIDRLVGQRLSTAQLPASPLADDCEFVRRAFLCLTGRIPTVDDTRGFLEDLAADKRIRLIDRLLASPHYGKHFANGWHRLLTGREFAMARPPDTRLLADWLTTAFNENRSWDELVKDIITAEGTHGEQPATIFFTLHGNSRGIPEPNVIAATAGKLFLGLDLECAECHDHPFQNWSQREFWGLAAFFSRVKDSGNKGGAKRWIKETPLESREPATLAIPESSFTNVGMEVAARLPDTDETDVTGRKSLRSVYAEWMTGGDNRLFAQNMANRIWAHCFGRGLMNPLNGFRRGGGKPLPDDPLSDHPLSGDLLLGDPLLGDPLSGDEASPPSPTHPELLELLARELAASGFDQKHLLRCICASETWQRSSQPLPASQDDSDLYSHRTPIVFGPEMLLDSLTVFWGGELLSSQRPKMDFRNPLLPLVSPGEEFLRLFRTLPKDAKRTRYTQGIPQLLFLMNSLVLNAESPIVSGLLESNSNAQDAIEHLYLAALSRRPDDEELSDAVDFVVGQKTSREGLEGVLWTLFNRSEFIINH